VRIHPSRCPDRLLDADVAERVAVTMQALASPSRVRLLACLAASPCSVGDLVTAVELEQSAVSHHLRTLRELGVVVGRRRGRRVIYALHDNHIRTLLDEAVRHVQPDAVPVADRRPAVAETDTDTGRYLTVTYIIAEPCIDVKDKSCIDVCPVDCIHEVDRMLVIDAEECIDCGACEPECPVEAIFPEDALPDKWEPFVKINYAYPDGDAINGLVDTYATEHNVQNTPPAA
jgi:DNA-binding transcriptional ArsR family regulator/NAD-dependent dihydropyrimidine dehydrogenase PreA subunit